MAMMAITTDSSIKVKPRRIITPILKPTSGKMSSVRQTAFPEADAREGRFDQTTCGKPVRPGTPPRGQPFIGSGENFAAPIARTACDKPLAADAPRSVS
jgi:hypothetical protein